MGHITPTTSVDWSCDTCHARFHIQRLNAWDFRVESTGMKICPSRLRCARRLSPDHTEAERVEVHAQSARFAGRIQRTPALLLQRAYVSHELDKPD